VDAFGPFRASVGRGLPRVVDRLCAMESTPPILMEASGRIQAAALSFMAGVMPPMPILGRSLVLAHPQGFVA